MASEHRDHATCFHEGGRALEDLGTPCSPEPVSIGRQSVLAIGLALEAQDELPSRIRVDLRFP